MHFRSLLNSWITILNNYNYILHFNNIIGLIQEKIYFGILSRVFLKKN